MTRLHSPIVLIFFLVNSFAFGQSDSELKKLAALHEATIQKLNADAMQLKADIVQLKAAVSTTQSDLSVLKAQAADKKQSCIAVAHNNGANCVAPYRYVVALGAVHNSVYGFAAGPKDIDICCL